jgi:hypothetical protein
MVLRSDIEMLEAPTERLERFTRVRGYSFVKYWTLINLAILLIVTIIPPVAKSPLFFLTTASTIFNVFVYLFVIKVPLKLNGLLVGLLLMQGWLSFTSMYADLTIARSLRLSVYDFRFFVYVLYFFSGYSLSYVFPETREWVRRLVLITLSLSLLVGFLQFLHFQPALRLAEIYIAKEDVDITAWDRIKGTRAIGLDGWPFNFARTAVVGFALAVGAALWRIIKPWEFMLSLLFLVGGIMAQARTAYPTIFLSFLILIYILLRQKSNAKWGYLAIIVAATAALFTLGYEQLGYALEALEPTKASSFQYRQEFAWPQALRILADRPWTGIGIDTNFEVGQTQGVIRISKWTEGIVLDSGYLLLLAWGGYPALFILILTFILAAIGLYKARVDKNLTHDQLPFLMLGVLYLLFLINVMGAENGITLTRNNAVLVFCMGLITPIPKKPRFASLPGRARSA